MDLPRLAAAQNADKDSQVSFPETSIIFQLISVVAEPSSVLCDVSKGHARLLVPAGLRREVFGVLHKSSQPGIRAPIKLVSGR